MTILGERRASDARDVEPERERAHADHTLEV